MSKKTIYNPTYLGKLTLNLRDAIFNIAAEFEQEHGRKNSAGRIFIHVAPEALAARNIAYAAGKREDVQFAAIAYVADDGALDYKNAELLEAITTVFGEQKLKFPNVAYSKGFLMTKGVKPTSELPTSGRVYGRIAAPAPAKTEKAPEAPTVKEESKELNAKPKRGKSAKNAEITHEDSADNETHAQH